MRKSRDDPYSDSEDPYSSPVLLECDLGKPFDLPASISSSVKWG